MKKIGLISLILIAITAFAANFALAADPFNTPAEITVVFRDSSGNLLRNINFEIYHQITDPDGRYALGDRVVNGNTGDIGRSIVKVNVRPFIEKGLGNRFVYKVYKKESGIEPFYFWNNDITNNTHQSKTFKLTSVKIYIKDGHGKSLSNFKFALFKEKVEDGGCNCNRKRIISTATESLGCKEFYLPEGEYSMEIYLPGNQIARRNIVVDGSKYNLIEHKLSTLGVILRDYNGEILKNKSFGIFKQERDPDGRIFFGDRVGTYSTESYGYKEILILPGVYIIQFSGNTKTDYILYNYDILSYQHNSLDYLLSSIKISYSNSSGNSGNDIIQGTIYNQESDDIGNARLGSKIFNFKIRTYDHQVFNLPPGKYAAKIGNETFYNLDICNNGQGNLMFKKTVNNLVINYTKECPPGGAISDSAPPSSDSDNFIYGKERLSSLAEEQRRAAILKQELEAIMGKGRIGVSANNWHTLVNAYIYGEYTPAEIADTIRCGPQAVHPTIAAPSWRKSGEYKKYLKRIGK